MSPLFAPCIIGAWLLASVCFMWHIGFLVSLGLTIVYFGRAVYAYFSNR